ncbi:MAG: hypothetical protein CVV64_03770 [Candidatus Wallbacteria bacterium HGW-Wallbacteria-1]|uniref:MurNAc-LAA domain-containing protein n=1 Tax=Candidatus Wallbacteria bacterium HGW-Wallbacteria-1 TaxID=2013854 RepID=A0A2N1PU36_9BACT|nr:MAG: hypothetical protein CVV64_03770 [Candidatus Wallbacteria bacterium HGW-Wallbacteria-1]
MIGKEACRFSLLEKSGESPGKGKSFVWPLISICFVAVLLVLSGYAAAQSSSAEMPVNKGRGIHQISGRSYVGGRKLQEAGIQVSWYPTVGILTLGTSVGPLRLFIGKDRYFEGFREKNFEKPVLEKDGEALVAMELLRSYPDIFSRISSDQGASGNSSIPEPTPAGHPAEFPEESIAMPTSAGETWPPSEKLDIDPFAEAVSPPLTNEAQESNLVQLIGVTSEGRPGEAVAISLSFANGKPLYDLQQIDEPRSLLLTLYGCAMESDGGVRTLAGKGSITDIVIDSADGDSLNLVANCSEPVTASISESDAAIILTVQPMVLELAVKASKVSGISPLSSNTVGGSDSVAVGSNKALSGSVTSAEPVQTVVPAGVDQLAEGIERNSLVLLSVFIDPGHGGKDNGLTGLNGGNFESSVNLQVALILARFLSAAGANVILSRENDRIVSGKERNDLLREKGSSMAVSIHCAWSGNPAMDGVSVFYPGLADRSYATAVKETLERELGCEERPAIKFPIRVFKGSPARCCLVEIGFLSNGSDSEKLSRSSYLVAVAKAIFEGIKNQAGRKR